MASQMKVCNFNCICNKSECSMFFHNIADLNERHVFRENVYSTINPRDYSETDPNGVRKANCRKGQLCRFENCNFKHFISFEGRTILIKKWYVERKKLLINKLVEELEQDKISKLDAAKVLRDVWGIRKEKEAKEEEEAKEGREEEEEEEKDD